MSEETFNGLSVEEQQTLREIHRHTLRVTEDLGHTRAGLENVERSVARLENSVDSIRGEVVKHGQLVSVLTNECTKRGSLCHRRFSKQSEEIDRVTSSIDEKLGRLEDTTDRIRIVHAEKEGEQKGRMRSWTIAVVIVGWMLTITGIVIRTWMIS